MNGEQLASILQNLNIKYQTAARVMGYSRKSSIQSLITRNQWIPEDRIKSLIPFIHKKIEERKSVNETIEKIIRYLA